MVNYLENDFVWTAIDRETRKINKKLLIICLYYPKSAFLQFKKAPLAGRVFETAALVYKWVSKYKFGSNIVTFKYRSCEVGPIRHCLKFGKSVSSFSSSLMLMPLFCQLKILEANLKRSFKLETLMETWGQFHQRSRSSFLRKDLESARKTNILTVFCYS